MNAQSGTLIKGTDIFWPQKKINNQMLGVGNILQGNGTTISWSLELQVSSLDQGDARR